MTSLRAVADQLTPEAGHFAIDAPAAWGQGRTLYGGMTAALAYEAVTRTHQELPPLRSAQFAFIGPASGRLRFSPTLLRRGRSSTIIAADCANAEGTAARAVFVFGAARESKVAHDFLPMPNVPAPDDSPPFRKGAPSTRGFWDNFETRLASGARLLDLSAPRPEFAVWTRFLDHGGADPVTAMLAIADCLPPAAMTHFPDLAPISTMTWSVDVMTPPPTADGWFLLASSSEHAADGYSMQSMTMWSESGAPLAVGRQAVAIFV
ncbi:MAG TPA: thioesterase family protein [Vitreimonas sp.]|uniref:acyl-CoA thioesterase n=1 Tax=Vitreimonas sp. TaxID=3069702 RepID=UPI002D733A9A|nr:thioesterase family protein [Vitreimonas sp.]HYD87676.1 thioesterase family protein [Vitreimonas sp.]